MNTALYLAERRPLLWDAPVAFVLWRLEEAKVRIAERRYREEGILRTFLSHLLMALAFALGKFEWANHVTYEFGDHVR
jgi:hypothetical protein